jgi:hypothetical protein
VGGFSNAFHEQNEKDNAKAAAMITLGPDEIRRRFGFSKVPPELTDDIVKMRERFIGFAQMIDMYVPPGQAKNIALTELETCSMWAIKAMCEEAETMEVP